MSYYKNTTIIILSSPRSGSRLLYEYLKEHSPNSDHLLNLNFWGLALDAINGDDKIFKARLKQYFSYLKIPDVITRDAIFTIWDTIVNEDGPIIIDKSPFYLDNFEILNLILEYKKRDNDVRFIAFYRHPLDAITSQEENGKYRLGYLKISEREKFYLKRYNNLFNFKQYCSDIFDCKYEDLLYNLEDTLNDLETFLGFKIKDNSLKDKYLTGRYNLSLNRNVRRWNISKDLEMFIFEHDYQLKPVLLKKNIFRIIFKSFKNETLALYYTMLFRLFKNKV